MLAPFVCTRCSGLLCSFLAALNRQCEGWEGACDQVLIQKSHVSTQHHHKWKHAQSHITPVPQTLGPEDPAHNL